jgi:Ca-activated chloride channel family protein
MKLFQKQNLLRLIPLFLGLAFVIYPFWGMTNAQQKNDATHARQTNTEVTATPTPSISPSTSPTAELEPEETITINTTTVDLNVRVIDRNGRSIGNIRKEDFKVYEDNVLQMIDDVTKREIPVNYGFVIDNSGSLRPQLEKVIEASKIMVNANREDDESFVIRFVSSDKIEILQDFTSNKNDLNEALDGMYVEGGSTAIIDAVFLAVEKTAEYEKSTRLEDRKRRAMILITDGEDRDSFYKEQQLFDRLREADVQIYPIGFVNDLSKEAGFIRKSPRDKAIGLLERLAKETGGKAYFPNSLNELPQIAKDIANELRTQYLISYYPTNEKRDGSFRTVKVVVADDPKQGKRIAITKTGYTAPREGNAPVLTNATPKKP